MPDRIENGIAYLNGLKVGDIYGSNYIEISNAGILSFKGTAHISDDSATADVFKAITVQYDASNKMELTVSSAGVGKILMTGSSDSFEIETGDGKIILDAGGDIDIDPAGNDINLLGAGAGKITLAATSMTVFGGDTTGDILVLQGNSADATEKITITGATGITLGGQVTVSNNMILAGRVSSTSLAGAAIAIDATTWQYGEGCELKYNVADWADTYTLTEASAILARMETNEASTNSVYGIQMWGVTNNVNVGNLWGGFAYAYVKGTSAKTITNIYAFQPEISFDAGSATNTITDAAVVRAKVTGGVMSDYTVLDGYRLTLGDMDGGSRTYGNGILLEDDSDMSGTCALTTGLNITIGCAKGISLAFTGTTASAKALSTAGFTLNNGNLGDGYGAVEVDLTLTGTVAGAVAGLSSWINAITVTTGANIIAAQTNGIYSEVGGVLSNSTLIFGMRAQCLAHVNGGVTSTEFYPFSIVNNTNVTTAIIQCNSADSDLGRITNAGADSGLLVPLYKDNTGVKYVKIYTAV